MRGSRLDRNAAHRGKRSRLRNLHREHTTFDPRFRAVKVKPGGQRHRPDEAPITTFDELVFEMVESDLRAIDFEKPRNDMTAR